MNAKIQTAQECNLDSKIWMGETLQDKQSNFFNKKNCKEKKFQSSR